MGKNQNAATGAANNQTSNAAASTRVPDANAPVTDPSIAAAIHNAEPSIGNTLSTAQNAIVIPPVLPIYPEQTEDSAKTNADAHIIARGDKPESETVSDDKLAAENALRDEKTTLNSEPGTTCLFKAHYPDDYKGLRHFIQDKVYEVAIDAAEAFVKQGIGKVVTA